MAYKISEDCISCGACESECPNKAIKEGDSIYVIDTDKCSECIGVHDVSKCAEVCPVDACKPDPDHAETKEQLMAKYNKLHGK
jgi:ferredoxin